MLRDMSDEWIEQRLNTIERMLASAPQKDLPVLNNTFQRLIDEQVRRDMAKEDSDAASNRNRR